MRSNQQFPTYDLIRNDRDRGIEVLYQRYGRKLYSYAVTSWNLDEDQSWDLVYTTLYKALEKIDEYEFQSEKKFGSFLFTIFCNNLRRQYRDARKRSERLSMSYFNESLFEESHQNPALATERRVMERLTENSMEQHQQENMPENVLLQKLETCLNRLEDWERILLLLRSQDMPYSEIAKYMHKPADQLKVYHQRARKKLADMLGDHSMILTDK